MQSNRSTGNLGQVPYIGQRTVASPRQQIDATALMRLRASTPNLMGSLQTTLQGTLQGSLPAASSPAASPVSVVRPASPGVRTVHPHLQQPHSWTPATPAPPAAPAPDPRLEAEIARRTAAEARVRELEALVGRLKSRIVKLEGSQTRRGGTTDGSATKNAGPTTTASVEVPRDSPIDKAIGIYLERNPDFPVSIQKIAPNHYVFGDRGAVYVTQRGEHIVVRVGGGFKSLQVFMDERALMVTREHASTLAERSGGHGAAAAA